MLQDFLLADHVSRCTAQLGSVLLLRYNAVARPLAQLSFIKHKLFVVDWLWDGPPTCMVRCTHPDKLVMIGGTPGSVYKDSSQSITLHSLHGVKTSSLGSGTHCPPIHKSIQPTAQPASVNLGRSMQTCQSRSRTPWQKQRRLLGLRWLSCDEVLGASPGTAPAAWRDSAWWRGWCMLVVVQCTGRGLWIWQGMDVTGHAPGLSMVWWNSSLDIR